MTNVILCGGSGTRLWPLSRRLLPKQFLKLFDQKSLFQLTLERNQPVCDHFLIVSNSEQYFLAVDQLEEMRIGDQQFVLEPVGRNTAPAIALACLHCDPDEVVLVLPSDHLVQNIPAYTQAVERAKELAQSNQLVTFGITPSYAETGYGYIQSAGEKVLSFKEKPSLEVAERYLQEGGYFWNSGMFCFKAGVYLDELKQHAPEIYEASFCAYEQAKKDSYVRITQEMMEAIPEDSIDYAVMEKSGRVVMVPCDIGWSDVGSFDSLSETLPNDSENNLVLADKKVVLIDVENLIVADTDDALLVAKKGSSQKVKEVVSGLKDEDSELPNLHLTVHRPWGTYSVLEDSPGFKIKKIVVKPGCKLSLQKHFHRNEHWIVVGGTAKVTVGEDSYLVRPNESTYIKMGDEHRLENPGKIPLILIEAQVGEYTNEDDIVRIQDDFERE